MKKIKVILKCTYGGKAPETPVTLDEEEANRLLGRGDAILDKSDAPEKENTALKTKAKKIEQKG